MFVFATAPTVTSIFFSTVSPSFVAVTVKVVTPEATPLMVIVPALYEAVATLVLLETTLTSPVISVTPTVSDSETDTFLELSDNVKAGTVKE